MRRKNGAWFLTVDGIELIYTSFHECLEDYWHYFIEPVYTKEV